MQQHTILVPILIEDAERCHYKCKYYLFEGHHRHFCALFSYVALKEGENEEPYRCKSCLRAEEEYNATRT